MKAIEDLSSKDFPGKRANATFFYYNGKHYLLGGGNRTKEFQDLWTLTLNKDKLEWTEIRPKDISPFTPRTGQAATLLGDKLYVFGGQNFHEGKMYDDAYCYDITENKWSFLETKEIKPSARNSAILEADPVKNRLYLYGGADLNGPLDDFYIYDLTKKEWFKIEFKGQKTPEPREMHTGFFYSGNLASAPEVKISKTTEPKTIDLHFSNSLTDGTEVEGEGEGPGEEEKKSETTNTTTTEEKEKIKGPVSNYLVVMGGKSAEKLHDEIWALNIQNLQWSVVGRMPQPLCAFGFALAGDRAFVYGGTDGAQFLDTLYVWDLKDNKWWISAAKVKTESLTMYRIASSLSYDNKNEMIVLFGGCSYEDELGDVHIINIQDTAFVKSLQAIKPK